MQSFLKRRVQKQPQETLSKLMAYRSATAYFNFSGHSNKTYIRCSVLYSSCSQSLNSTRSPLNVRLLSLSCTRRSRTLTRHSHRGTPLLKVVRTSLAKDKSWIILRRMVSLVISNCSGDAIQKFLSWMGSAMTINSQTPTRTVFQSCLDPSPSRTLSKAFWSPLKISVSKAKFHQ